MRPAEPSLAGCPWQARGPAAARRGLLLQFGLVLQFRLGVTALHTPCTCDPVQYGMMSCCRYGVFGIDASASMAEAEYSTSEVCSRALTDALPSPFVRV